MVIILTNLGHVTAALGKCPVAKDYYLQALPIAQEINLRDHDGARHPPQRTALVVIGVQVDDTVAEVEEGDVTSFIPIFCISIY